MSEEIEAAARIDAIKVADQLAWDRFAAAALGGIASVVRNDTTSYANCAYQAALYADAMMEYRAQHMKAGG